MILSSNARPLLTSKAEFKDSPRSRPSRKEAFQSEKYQPTPSEYEERAKDEKASTNSSMDHLKEKLKEDHRKGLNRLKASLQSVRAMKIGALHQKKNYESEEELMNTLERLKTELDQQEKGIIAGYKQRCISETRAIKKKFHDGTGSLENLNLDENEKNLAAQIAAKSLRDKYV